MRRQFTRLLFFWIILGAPHAARTVSDSIWIRIVLSEQRLDRMEGQAVLQSWPVSTSKYGAGNREGSERTPLGLHVIAEMIGDGAPVGMIFKSRKPTGRIAVIHADTTDVPDDMITTRILRLRGCEPGVNLGEGIDSYERFIYIHGTQEEGLIGTPVSHGCIRMKNRDIIALFDTVCTGMCVEIIQ